MAPVRRYLRITRFSVLECRIYIDGSPSESSGWLIRNLPRIFEAIRHKVLPNLREEKARAKAKGKGRAKAIKDVVIKDDFEVSIYLKDQSSRHSIVTKHKTFGDKPQLKSNSTRLTGWLNSGTNDRPIDVDENQDELELLVEEEDDEDTMVLAEIPEASPRPKNLQTGKDKDEALFVHSSDSEDDLSRIQAEPRARWQNQEPLNAVHGKGEEEEQGGGDDKKKLGLQTTYEGFAIYGRILCLVVKRKGATAVQKGNTGGPAMMENWVSTQVAQEMGIDQDSL
ncbi:hypothetical protein EJ08DRAFT_666927 [Tothia fuscella]|uniref:Uncharacterized protein n=1 Tax=Tothia fuscella TaxID=1048955 RepID=A0A9P4P3R0_9PEZI|nr:hypothetical protein EJ08DRAFT_666927 [Tothia fuscella]